MSAFDALCCFAQPGQLGTLVCMILVLQSRAVESKEVCGFQAARNLSLRVAERMGGVAMARPRYHLFGELDLPGRRGKVFSPEAAQLIVSNEPERVHDLPVEALGKLMLGEVR